MSWGTKGDNKVSTDLGVVATTGKDKATVEASVPTDQRDINAAYEDAMAVLSECLARAEGEMLMGLSRRFEAAGGEPEAGRGDQAGRLLS